MEGMVANYTRDYGRTNPRWFGDYSYIWRKLPEWISCIPITIWML